MQEALQSRSPGELGERADRMIQLTRHLRETFWVKDVTLGTGIIEMSNANSVYSVKWDYW